MLRISHWIHIYSSFRHYFLALFTQLKYPSYNFFFFFSGYLFGKKKKWNKGKVNILFAWAPKPLQTVTSATKLKDWKKKSMTNIDNLLKSRNNILMKKIHIVKAMFFPVVMYRCENWTIRKAEHWRTDAFKLWCWKRVLRAPWTARRSNESILKEINTEYSLGRLMLWPPDEKSQLIGKDPNGGKDWG